MKKTLIISGQFTSLSGYGRKSFDIAKSFIDLYSNDFDIKLFPMKWGATKNDYKDDDEITKLFIYQINYRPDIYIHIGLPNEMNPMGLEKNILFTSGIETNVAPQSFVEGCNRADLIVVPSTFVKTVLEQTSYRFNDNNGNLVNELKIVKPIEVLFEGFDEDIFKEITYSENKLLLKNIPETFCFLFVGTWLDGELGQDRKDVGMLVKVFLEVFKNKIEKPALILKTNGATTSITDRDNILKKIEAIKESVGSKNLPNIYLLHGDLNDEEMNSLYHNNKIKGLVSLTKGEGFSRTFLEFATTGKPVIVSAYSGHLDFLKPEYNFLIGGKVDKVHPSAVNEFILKESSWFTVDYNQVAGFLNVFYKDYKKFLEISKKQISFVRRNFSVSKMKEKLKSIIDEYIPKQVELKLPSYVSNTKNPLIIKKEE